MRFKKRVSLIYSRACVRLNESPWRLWTDHRRAGTNRLDGTRGCIEREITCKISVYLIQHKTFKHK